VGSKTKVFVDSDDRVCGALIPCPTSLLCAGLNEALFDTSKDAEKSIDFSAESLEHAGDSTGRDIPIISLGISRAVGTKVYHRNLLSLQCMG
jgi:hypothetical protein